MAETIFNPTLDDENKPIYYDYDKMVQLGLLT